MRKRLYRFFAPPVFPNDEDKSRLASILNVIGWSIIVVLLSLLLIRNVSPQVTVRASINFIFLAIILITALTLLISRLGYVQLASLIMITMGWAGLTSFAWSAEGLRDVAISGYFVPILMAGLLLGWRGAIGFTALSITSSWFFMFAETNGLLTPQLGTPLNFARDLTGVFVIAGVLISLMIRNLQNAINKLRSASNELSVSNKELSDLRDDLEQRVEDRTAQLQKRAAQLEAVASVAHTIASVQDLDTLLPAITKLISEQFGFYHVGIFLLEEQHKNAILRASNSEGGLQMLERRYSLPVDDHSLVGYAISRGEPRIALNVASDSVFLNNPHLPATRSEIALPLRVAGRVIGSLDVQSKELNAFSEEDTAVLATLSDQVAIAIENARVFGEAKSALDESRALFETYTQQEWMYFARQAKQTGFIFDGKQVAPLDGGVKRESTRTAIHTGRLSLEKESDSIAIPIKLRGQTIGVLDVRSKKGTRPWKPDEITMLEAAAERAALALETARLVDSAQRRASRERAIGDISAKIGAVSNLESILQTAVEELGRKLGGATEVTLEINTDDGQNGHEHV
ncbi:MAG TPA: GAF domain-containing protein [Anaerolineales bacterium]|nr:GAF domain-containing protein [Anaerolineales bacterium]